MSKKNKKATTSSPIMDELKQQQQQEKPDNGNKPTVTKESLEKELGIKVWIMDSIEKPVGDSDKPVLSGSGKDNKGDKDKTKYIVFKSENGTFKAYRPSNTENVGRDFLDNGHKMDEDKLTDLIEIVNAHMDDYTEKSYHQEIGWGKYNGQHIFKLHQAATENETINSLYYGNQPIEIAGSKEEYIQGVRQLVAPYSKLFIAYAVGFTGIINQQLKQSETNIMVALCGRSGRGKTTATKLMFSSWGDPQKLLMTYNTTDNQWEMNAADRQIIPTSIDDILADKENSSFKKLIAYIAKIIFRASDSKSKDRMYDPSKKYFGGLLVSAESSLIATQIAANSSGQLYRLIELMICGNDLTKDADHADQIDELISENYGHAASEFGSYMVKNGFTGKKLKDMYTAICAELAEDERIKAEKRIKNRLGVLMLTIKLVNDCFGFNVNLEEIKEVLIKNALYPFTKVNENEVMYNKLLALAKDNKEVYFSDKQKTFISESHIGVFQSNGFKGVELIIPSDRMSPLFHDVELDKILEHCNDGGGYDMDDEKAKHIIQDWKKRGYLSCIQRRNQKILSIGGQKDTPVYVIKYPNEKQ